MTAAATPAAEHLVFANRCAAGRQLATRLARYGAQQPVVLALPRGGVAVAYEVAHALEAPLRLLVVRKILAPGRPPLVIGAVAPGGVYLDEETIALVDIPDAYVNAAVEHERDIARRLLRDFGGDSLPLDLEGRTALIVDDGIVTGSSALAAVDVVRQERAVRVVVAAPVCAADAYEKLRARADDVVCIARLEEFRPLASAYADLSPTSDEEVRRLVKLARLEREAGYRRAASAT